jgi:hypothetical protein
MSVLALRLLTGLDRPDSNGEEAVRPPYTATETVLVLTAGLAFIGGLIHIGAGIDHWEEFHLYTLAFSLIAAVQITWAVLLLRRPSRGVLLAGALFQLGVVALWALSRTTGVPIAPQPWVPEEIGVADVVATIGEIVTIAAAVAILSGEGHPLVRRVLVRLAPVVMAAVLMSALLGTGAHAG